MTYNILWIVTFVFCKSLLTSNILELSICISTIAILILEESYCSTVIYYLSNSVTWIWELPLSNCCVKNFHASEQSHSLIPVEMRECITFVTSGNYLISMEAKRRLKLLLFSYFTNKSSSCCSFQGPLRDSPIFFGFRGFSGRQNWRCETTDLTW